MSDSINHIDFRRLFLQWIFDCDARDSFAVNYVMTLNACSYVEFT